MTSQCKWPIKADPNYLDHLRTDSDPDLNSSRTKFKRRKILNLKNLLAKYVIIIYALGSVHEKGRRSTVEIPGVSLQNVVSGDVHQP